MRTKRYLGIEIRALDNQIKRMIDRKMHKSDFCRITGSNGWIIDYIRTNSPRPVYQKDLEAEFNITRSTASKVLNLMEEKGFIVRESVPEDARLKKLVLTPKAIEVSKEMEANRAFIESQITKGFSAKELEQFYSYIERIRKNVTEI